MGKRRVIPGLTVETPVREAAIAILRAKAEPMFKLEAAARSGKDIEALHDMRVASRRLREALQIFRPLYRKRAFQKNFGLVRAVTRALGSARNYDVGVAFFTSYRAEMADGDLLGAVEFLLKRQRKGQQRARKQMVEQLRALRLRGARAKLYAFFADQKRRAVLLDGGIDPDKDLAQNTRPLMEARLKAMFEHRRGIEDESRVDLLHRMRIATKKARYAMETLRVAFDERFDEGYAVVREAQERLGDIHDLDVLVNTVDQTREEVEDKRRTRPLTPGMMRLGDDLRSRRHELYVEFMGFVRQHDERALTQQILDALVTRSPAGLVEAQRGKGTKAQRDKATKG